MPSQMNAPIATAAAGAAEPAVASCCGPSCCGGEQGAGEPVGRRAATAPAPAPSSAPAPGATFTIRPATPADLTPVRVLLAAAALPAEIEPSFGEGFAVAVDAAGRIVGATGIELHGDAPPHGLLRSAVVDPSWRGRGVGERLTRDRLDWARERGIGELWLLTTTAAEWFPRFGFVRADRADAPEPLRRSAEFTTACPASATAMRLESTRVDASPRAPSGDPSPGDAVRSIVREKYGEAARRATAGESASCGCGTSCCGAGETWNPITAELYEQGETAGLPPAALLASLGCGNPTALAELRPGETVLDLGSGGGIDVLLSARRVGATGKVYGLDMTDDMLALAESNRRAAGATNVEFLKGEIERIPLPDASVDVIISNCVINLSADKRRVLAEAFRVLKPGGRFAVSDVVARGAMPDAVRRSAELWIGCVAGALEESEYRALLAESGFESIDVEPTRIYEAADARALLAGAWIDEPTLAAADGKFMSAFVRARKPGR
jgi:arsenite methyltransferase